MIGIAASTACLVVLVVVAWRWWRAYPEREIAPSLMNAREQATVRAVADAFFPAGGPIPLSGSEAGIVAYFDARFAAMERRQRLLVRLLFAFTELAPLIFGGWKRFTRLSPARRERYLARSWSSGIYMRRVTFLSLRALMTMAYVANDEVARRMGCKADLDPFGLAGGEPPAPTKSGVRAKAPGVTALERSDPSSGAA
jgi:hypothetical protein